MSDMTPKLDGRAWVYLIVLALLWSLSFIFIKVGAAEIPVLTLVLLRVGIAALVLNAVVIASGRRYPAQPQMLARYLVMGLLNNVLPFALIVYATARLGAGAASILNATAPIFALIVAHVATRDEKITPGKLTGILLGVCGVAAMTGPQALAGLGGEILPVAAMLAATFCYGLSAVYGRSFGGIDPIVSATCQLTASTLILAPLVLVFDRPFALPLPSTTAILAVLGLALFATAIAYVIFYALIARAGGMNTMLVTLLIPVGGVALAFVLLGEPFSLDEAVGMVLIGLGLVVIDGRALGRLRRPASMKSAREARRAP
jgi:drug/metabolite transporter (DMT)-like permease